MHAARPIKFVDLKTTWPIPSPDPCFISQAVQQRDEQGGFAIWRVSHPSRGSEPRQEFHDVRSSSAVAHESSISVSTVSLMEMETHGPRRTKIPLQMVGFQRGSGWIDTHTASEILSLSPEVGIETGRW